MSTEQRWTWQEHPSYVPAYWLHENGEERCRVDTRDHAMRMCDALNAVERMRAVVGAARVGCDCPNHQPHYPQCPIRAALASLDAHPAEAAERK